MIRLKTILSIVAALCLFQVSAKEYKASYLGIRSNGTSLNTTSIQKAIDYIHDQGGGSLVFYVGRYLTGTIEMKSNVHIVLKEGAILVGSTNIAENIGITGKGVIEGNGNAVAKSLEDQSGKGYLGAGELKSRPALTHLNECSNISLDGIILRNACGDVQVYEGCKNININNLTVMSSSNPNSNGLVLSNCDGVALGNSFFETSGDELLESKTSKNITVVNSIDSKGRKLKIQL